MRKKELFITIMDNKLSGQILLILAILVICLLLFVIVWLKRKLKAERKTIQQITTRVAKYKQIIDLTEDVTFEYDIRTDIMYHSDRYNELFARNPIIYNYTEALVELPYVHSEDQLAFQDFCKALHIGKSNFTFEFRFINKNREYEWCHVNGNAFSESKGLPNLVLGRIVNIDAQKRELDRLRFKAQRDLMTNVFNKKTTMDKINEIIKKGKSYEKHALFVIDIDDFKRVNDTYGHLQGDHVLTTIVNGMVEHFTEDDIIGRIGGDEFVVLMKNIASKEQIVQKAESVCKIFNQTFNYNEEVMRVSCSIGIAIYPMDGSCYEELMERADVALYEVKSDGKNSFMLYSDLNEWNKLSYINTP